MHPWVLIPAFNPNGQLGPLLDQLLKRNLNVLLINDGSHPEATRYLQRLSRRKGIHYLEHARNRGKGATLKTGFQHILKSPVQVGGGVVVADADGQHSPEDIVRVAQEMKKHPESIILSQRAFAGEVPWRSYLGNRITAGIFWAFSGTYLRDTQSGLRGIPRNRLSSLCRLHNNRYDFELRFLLEMFREKWSFRSIPIRTIYLEGNRSSQFRPWIDSLRIYYVFFRYCLSSILTALVDYLLFSIAYLVQPNIFVATALGRVGAGLLNFHLNRTRVFRSSCNISQAAMEYVALVVLLWALSSSMIHYVHQELHLTVLYAKAAVEITLFALGFAVQRSCIFRRKDK